LWGKEQGRERKCGGATAAAEWKVSLREPPAYFPPFEPCPSLIPSPLSWLHAAFRDTMGESETSLPLNSLSTISCSEVYSTGARAGEVATGDKRGARRTRERTRMLMMMMMMMRRRRRRRRTTKEKEEKMMMRRRKMTKKMRMKRWVSLEWVRRVFVVWEEVGVVGKRRVRVVVILL